MKRIVVNSALVACLLTLLVSFWMVANPVHALAASSKATCANGQDIQCAAASSQCFSVDSQPGAPGYCLCISNSTPSTVTDHQECTDSDEVPYIE